MGLAQVQDVLTRLYTDAAMLEAWLCDPVAVLSRFRRLTAGERADLLRLDRERLVFYAHSLRHKRYNEVRPLLPPLDVVEETFMAYARRHPIPSGLNLATADARQFCRWWMRQPGAPRQALRACLERLQ